MEGETGTKGGGEEGRAELGGEEGKRRRELRRRGGRRSGWIDMSGLRLRIGYRSWGFLMLDLDYGVVESLDRILELRLGGEVRFSFSIYLMGGKCADLMILDVGGRVYDCVNRLFGHALV